MSEIKQFTDKIRIFHYTTLVPICILEQDEIVCSLPEKINYVNQFVKEAYSIETIFNFSKNDEEEEQIKALYYKNEYEECFILIELKENMKILAGPILNEKLFEGHVNNIIRGRKLPIKIKGKLTGYYDSLLVIDSDRFYYCGKLLEFLLSSEYRLKNIKTDDSMNEFLPDAYFANMVKNRESQFHHPPYFLEQELLSKIKTGNLSDSMNILREINSLKRTMLADDAFRSIKNSLICSITLFTRAAIEGGVQPEASFTLSDALILELEEINTLTKLINIEYKAVEQFIKLVQERSTFNYSNTIKQALSFIYKNLTNKLTLTEISTAIYVHPNYLSSLFKKEVGVSLSDYITKIRIEESKYYIKYSNTKISELAMFYQFCNQSYFIAAFKKFTGLTPSEYRKKYIG